jgi:REP element-mobilizing transposase RayT
MRKARWLATWRHSGHKPVFYHCISRVVDRRFVLGAEEKEKFRALMRVYERFSGCRVLSYCLMDNHFHLLLEVPPPPEPGLSDDELLKRLSALYNPATVATVAKQLADARKATYTQETGLTEAIAAIHQRHTYRMHDLGEFMKTLLQRFTQWYNQANQRTGTLWEDRFKSLIVEDGTAARTIAAYIDLNSVRAGIVKDPADYRWCSYGEAIGGGKKGNGKKAREGLVRAYHCDQGIGYDIAKWDEVSRLYRRLMGLAIGKKPGQANIPKSKTHLGQTTKNTAELLDSEDNETALKDLGIANMLRCRIRYFTDGAVIGSRQFVNEAFATAKHRFGPKRKDGARPLKGQAAPAKGTLWTLRDLRKGIA